MNALDSLPAAYGRYVLEERIAMGGMAEVFRARIDADGFAKRVCIKRILPHVASAQDFIDMFRDEAALSAVLSHQNICQVFDFGEVGGTFYLAMELVDGIDLNRLMRHLARTGKKLKVLQALQIAVDVARALHHAHTVTNQAGRPLGIVHRDVSPHNILLSRAGDVKVADFGIAKATDRLTQTATGVLKGKAGYMSPEQALGAELDHRSDQFAAGIVLWEMLTGTRLFGEGGAASALLKLVECRVPPPSSLRPDLPPALDEVVLRALSKNPDDRYADMRAFQQALLRLRFGSDEDPTEAELAPLVREALGDEPARGGSQELAADLPTGITGGPTAITAVVEEPPSAEPSGGSPELSVFDTASAIQRTASGAKYAPLIERLERMHPFRGEYSDLVERFPSLRGAAGVRPWNPFLLDAWAKDVPVEELDRWDSARPVRSPQAFHAATFVIRSFFGRMPAVMPHAQEVWDTEHKAAYASFFRHWTNSPPGVEWWQR